MILLCKVLACFLVVISLSGCTQHYRVTDPASRKTYYTTNWQMNKRFIGQGVSFTETGTGKQVNLASYELERVSEEDVFKAPLRTNPVGYDRGY